MPLGALLRNFVRINRRISESLQDGFPHTHAHFDPEAAYERHAVDAIQRESGKMTVLDVGGGKHCPYAHAKKSSTHIVAMDISERELSFNQEVDEKIVADVTQGIPTATASIDLLTARYGVEHFPDQSSFVSETSRVLRPGGHMVLLFPCRNAVFAFINRHMENSRAKQYYNLLMGAPPEEREEHVFPVHYDRCTPAEYSELLEQYGFEIETLDPSYYQAYYFAFLPPLYALVLCYEFLLWAFDTQELCASVLLVAKKKSIA